MPSTSSCVSALCIEAGGTGSAWPRNPATRSRDVPREQVRARGDLHEHALLQRRAVGELSFETAVGLVPLLEGLEGVLHVCAGDLRDQEACKSIISPGRCSSWVKAQSSSQWPPPASRWT
jgi:hypothetical protein